MPGTGLIQHRPLGRLDEGLGAVEAGYALALGPATVTPFAGAEFGTVDQDGFTETGAGVLDLHNDRRA